MFNVEILVDNLNKTEVRACPHLGLRQVNRYSLSVYYSHHYRIYKDVKDIFPIS